MKAHGFYLDDLKIILPEKMKGLGVALGANTVLFNYVALKKGEKERRTNPDNPQPDYTYNRDLSFGTWIHEFFHIVDTRLEGISHKDKAWGVQYEAAKKRQKEAKNYAIPDTGCGGIKNGDYHYELTTKFEFFAVVMTARINICKAGKCIESPSKDCYFQKDRGFTLPSIENESQLKALLPEAYKLATKVLEKGLPAAQTSSR